MRPRYLIAVGPARPAIDVIKSRARKIMAGARLRSVLESDRLLVFADGRAPLAMGPEGILIGSAFMRGSASPPAAFSKADQDAIAAIGGEWLIRACWGGYMAILVDTPTSRVDILRAPLGDLGCYIGRSDKVLLCASDVPLLLAAGVPKPSLDPAALARQLAAAEIRRAETCLVGVRELAGGEKLTILDGKVTREALWSPWAFAARERQIPEAKEAVRRVRDAARHCVAARAGAFDHVLLKLSGGLDSSIVAACLSQAGQTYTGLTLATEDPAADERGYAGLVARALDAPLVERFRDLRGVELMRSAAASLPRPCARGFTQESARIAAEVASDVGAAAIFDGGGGDNIFCSLQSVRPALDCLLSEAGAGRFIETSRTIARLTGTSLLAVARRAWVARWRGRTAYPWPLDTRFLSAPAKEAALEAAAHPWLEPPEGALPGKAAHVALIAAAQSVAEGFDAQEPLATYSPLISQPLVEACLQVPTWLWFDDDLNRAVARHAFRDALPRATVRRRSKGAPDSFIADLYEANRSLIRTMLLDGVLTANGLLDLPVLARTLDDEGPVRGHDFLRVMQLVDAEAWARGWS